MDKHVRGEMSTRRKGQTETFPVKRLSGSHYYHVASQNLLLICIGKNEETQYLIFSQQTPLSVELVSNVMYKYKKCPVEIN